MLQTQWLVAVSRRTSLPFYSAASLTTATAAGMGGGNNCMDSRPFPGCKLQVAGLQLPVAPWRTAVCCSVNFTAMSDIAKWL